MNNPFLVIGFFRIALIRMMIVTIGVSKASMTALWRRETNWKPPIRQTLFKSNFSWFLPWFFHYSLLILRHFSIFRILQAFPRLNIDIWAAYQILLAGKADINCLFKMVHESCESRMDEVLADALIYGNELKGEEKYGIFIQFLDWGEVKYSPQLIFLCAKE